MIVLCSRCEKFYDDTERLTYCPHEFLVTAEDMKRKDAALALMGKRIRFAHQPDGPTHQILSINWKGMIVLGDMTGEFDPRLFKLEQDK